MWNGMDPLGMKVRWTNNSIKNKEFESFEKFYASSPWEDHPWGFATLARMKGAETRGRRLITCSAKVEDPKKVDGKWRECFSVECSYDISTIVLINRYPYGKKNKPDAWALWKSGQNRQAFEADYFHELKHIRSSLTGILHFDRAIRAKFDDCCLTYEQAEKESKATQDAGKATTDFLQWINVEHKTELVFGLHAYYPEGVAPPVDGKAYTAKDVVPGATLKMPDPIPPKQNP